MATAQETAEELHRAIAIRSRALEEASRRLRGPLSRARGDLRTGLDLIETFAREVRRAAQLEWDRTAPDPAAQEQVLTPLLRSVTLAASLLERHFAHGDRRELSEALTREIRSVLEELGLGKYRVIASHGDPNNFLTSYGDVEGALFTPIDPIVGRPGLAGRPYALFQVPRIEGSHLYWRPWLLGHEVAHVAVTELKAIEAFDLGNKFDHAAASALISPGVGAASPPILKRRALFEIARGWLTELLCDAFALLRYGPAAIAALGEYSVTSGSMDLLSTTHPPGSMRLELLSMHLGAITEPRLSAVVLPQLAVLPNPLTLSEPWAEHLHQFFLNHQVDVLQVVKEWPATPFSWDQRTELTLALADRVMSGLPGAEIVELDGVIQAASDADVVNAVWVARCEGSQVPIDDLGRKALSSLEFCRRWVGGGGALPLLTRDTPHEPALVGFERGTLSETSLINRMHPDCQRRLDVLPLLQRPRGSAIDLRLGNRFIVFRRTAVGSFDTLELGSDPRIMQTYVELDWSEQFVLHPNEMVLGASLEYLGLPSDLTAQVASRSSYGRLGLLSATAVQVHPFFHGCLTLELVNLSTIPLTLSPGERIAQLVINATDEVPDPGAEKYVYATGPEFSKVRDDDEADVLRRLRS